MSEIYSAAKSGHLDQAQLMITQVLQNHPDSAKAHYVAAELYAKKGNTLLGSKELNAAEHLDPGLPFAIPEAVASLKEQLGLATIEVAVASQSAAAYFRAGFGQMQSGQLAEAEGNFKFGLSIKPNDVKARFYLAQVLQKEGKLSEARLQYMNVTYSDSAGIELAQQAQSAINSISVDLLKEAPVQAYVRPAPPPPVQAYVPPPPPAPHGPNCSRLHDICVESCNNNSSTANDMAQSMLSAGAGRGSLLGYAQSMANDTSSDATCKSNCDTSKEYCEASN